VTADSRDKTNWAFSTCQCGCGQRTKGYRSRYLRAHQPRIPLADRLWSRVDRSGDCWVWTGRTMPPLGYGQIGRGSRSEGLDTTHRVAWEVANGRRVPDGLYVLHRCDNPPWCNPAHLFLGTAGDNSRDMAAKGRTGTSRGLAHPHGRLSDAQVLEILARYRNGERAALLAIEFKIHHQYVLMLARGAARQYLTNPGRGAA
jgi:hypothetical protein